MDEITNIWNADDDLNDEQLMKYAQGNLTDKDAHDIEKKISDSALLNDGVEGLQEFSSAEKINSYVQQVNNNLHQNLTGKNIKQKKKIAGLTWQIITVVIIILLCILGYVVLEMMRK